MFADLGSIRLSPAARKSVDRAREVYEENGSLPMSMVSQMRKLYKSYGKAIRQLHESRERGRISLAKEAMKLTDKDVEKRRSDRLEDLRKKLTDLGI